MWKTVLWCLKNDLKIVGIRRLHATTWHQRAHKSFPRSVHSLRTKKIEKSAPNLRTCNEKRVLYADESTGSPLQFPFVWLRDNCQCPNCFHGTSRSRIINWESFDVNVNPSEVQFDSIEETLQIKWSDEHHSSYPLEWLRKHDFTAENRRSFLQNVYRPAKRPWAKSDFQKILKTFDFQSIIESDDALFEWLDALAKNGVAMIENTPLTPNEARRLSDRVAFIRKTHYGEEYIVQARDDTNNAAYLTSALQPHTDLPYYDYKPGVNLLHCLVQATSTGGDNLLADGLFVAQRLREHQPEVYETLSTVMVNWNDIGVEEGRPFHSALRAPVFCENREGELERINHSIPQRDSQFSIPLEDVDRWYRALAQFVKIVYEESVHFKTKPGDILTFDNMRSIHGRTAYRDNQGNTRYLVGAFLDWDEIYSRWRVIKSKRDAQNFY